DRATIRRARVRHLPAARRGRGGDRLRPQRTAGRLMAFPAFYAEAPRITMRDPLAAFLGAADEGLIEYSYADAVRVAGHSCPTVAGTWLMARGALVALYAGEVPERGALEVIMGAPEDEGTTGVMAQVFTLLTGATAGNGFHGIGG